LVTQVSLKVSISSHQSLMVYHSRPASGRSAAHDGDAEQAAGGVEVGAREQHPEAFFHAPGGTDLGRESG
jgi:hypothetical protein